MNKSALKFQIMQKPFGIMLTILAFILFGCGQPNTASVDTNAEIINTEVKAEKAIEEVTENLVTEEEVKEKVMEKPKPKEEEKKEVKKTEKKKTSKKKRSKTPIIKWAETNHKFGTVEEGNQVNHKFFFENTGKTNLLITEATATCGCTVPSYPKVPIRPGESSYIRIAFNTKAKTGAQKPVVTIYTNARKEPFKLYMEGEVTQKTEGEPVEEGGK